MSTTKKRKVNPNGQGAPPKKIVRGSTTTTPWRLEIHHIDVDQGDSTLVVAHKNNKVEGSLLIDGGLHKMKPRIDKYVKQVLNGEKLGALVVTHWDADHADGISALLDVKPSDPTLDDVCSIVRAYDLGDAPAWPLDLVKLPGKNAALTRQKSTLKKYTSHGICEDYKDAFDAALTARTRMTAVVDAVMLAHYTGFKDSEVPTVPPVPTGTDPTTWLLGMELLWAGNPPYPHAPTVKCITVNKWVGDPRAPVFTDRRKVAKDMDIWDRAYPIRPSELNDNAQSIGLLVEFGSFRYFLGGDLEVEQEKALCAYLNPNKTLTNRIHGVKLNHHGSSAANSAEFFNHFRPEFVVISVGLNNSYGLPGTLAIQNIEQSQDISRVYSTSSGARTAQTKPHIVSGDDGKGQGTRILGHVIVGVDEHPLGPIPIDVTFRTGNFIQGTQTPDVAVHKYNL